MSNLIMITRRTFAPGTVAAPSITFSGDPDTGIYNVGADILGITVGGVLTTWFQSGLVGFVNGVSLATAAVDGATLLLVARNAAAQTQTVAQITGNATIANSTFDIVKGRLTTNNLDANNKAITALDSINYGGNSINFGSADADMFTLSGVGIAFPTITPPAAVANKALLYSDTSAGKVRLMVLMPTGAAIQLAIEA